MTTITATLPVYTYDRPNPADGNDKFSADVMTLADFLVAMADAAGLWSPQVNAVALEIASSAAAALSSQNQAQSYAEIAAAWANATTYNDTATYKFPALVISETNGQRYCCLSPVDVSGIDPVGDETGTWSNPLGLVGGINVLQEIDCTGLSTLAVDCSLSDNFVLSDIDTDIEISLTNLTAGAPVVILLMGTKTGTVSFAAGTFDEWLYGAEYSQTDYTDQVIVKQVTSAGHVVGAVADYRPVS